jgi:uncharacterized protein YndB with AHSA1/START domain
MTMSTTTTTTTTDQPARGTHMADIRIVRDYPHEPKKVWRALTDPALMALWMMRPEGFAPVVGTRFKLVAKPQPGWRGFVECEVLEVVDGSLLRTSWIGDDNGKATYVTYRLEPHAQGTRLTFEHTGFRGIGGFLLSKLMLGPGWKKMLSAKVPEVLADVDDDGKLRAGSTLTPKF